MRIGSGIRTKILEAFANGIPVISTTIGMEGIKVENGVHCLIADTSADFTQAIKTLTKDLNLQKVLFRYAYQFVQKEYSIKLCGERRIQVLSEIVSKDR